MPLSTATGCRRKRPSPLTYGRRDPVPRISFGASTAVFAAGHRTDASRVAVGGATVLLIGIVVAAGASPGMVPGVLADRSE